MTLEEIKNIAESSSDHIEMLEAEVEKLQAENEDLHKDGMTIYAMMEDGRAKAAVERCVDIVKDRIDICFTTNDDDVNKWSEWSRGFHCGQFDILTSIKKEFKL